MVPGFFQKNGNQIFQDRFEDLFTCHRWVSYWTQYWVFGNLGVLVGVIPDLPALSVAEWDRESIRQ